MKEDQRKNYRTQEVGIDDVEKFNHLWLTKFIHLKYDCRNLDRQKMLMFRYVTLTSI